MTGRAATPSVAAAALACLVALSGAGCTGSGDDGPRPGRGPASSAATTAGLGLTRRCPPPPARPERPGVDEINRLVASADLPGWQTGDVGASGLLSDGRIVWLFGDTTRRDLEPGLVANSMLVTSGRCVAQVLDAVAGPVIPGVSHRIVRWPMSVVVVPRKTHDELVVLCARIDRGTTGPFGFTFLGTSAAVFSVAPGEAPRLRQLVDITPDSRDTTQVNWGAAATTYDGWHYVYGTRLTGRPYDVGRELYVARVPAADPRQRSSWQFWDGARWQGSVDRAAAVLPSRGGVSQTLSVDTLRGSFVAVSKRDGDVGDFVYRWTAPHPWGPWTAVEELRAPAGLDTGNLEYMPLAHPEVELASGRLLVSISRNTTDLDRLARDPGAGRPLFVALPR